MYKQREVHNRAVPYVYLLLEPTPQLQTFFNTTHLVNAMGLEKTSLGKEDGLISPEEVKDYFDRWARGGHTASYDTQTENWLYHPEKNIAKALLPLLDKATLLDIGCGTGKTAKPFLEAGHVLDGVDLSPGMMALATGYRTLLEADIMQELPELGQYDGIISAGVFGDAVPMECLLPLLRHLKEDTVIAIAGNKTYLHGGWMQKKLEKEGFFVWQEDDFGFGNEWFEKRYCYVYGVRGCFKTKKEQH